MHYLYVFLILFGQLTLQRLSCCISWSWLSSFSAFSIFSIPAIPPFIRASVSLNQDSRRSTCPPSDFCSAVTASWERCHSDEICSSLVLVKLIQTSTSRRTKKNKITKTKTHKPFWFSTTTTYFTLYESLWSCRLCKMPIESALAASYPRAKLRPSFSRANKSWGGTSLGLGFNSSSAASTSLLIAGSKSRNSRSRVWETD